MISFNVMLLIAGLCAVVAVIWGVFWLDTQSLNSLPPPTRSAPPMPHVEPTRPWPTQSLRQRYIQRAKDALDRPMLSDGEIEDALSSAEFFIRKAREVRPAPVIPQPAE